MIPTMMCFWYVMIQFVVVASSLLYGSVTTSKTSLLVAVSSVLSFTVNAIVSFPVQSCFGVKTAMPFAISVVIFAVHVAVNVSGSPSGSMK